MFIPSSSAGRPESSLVHRGLEGDRILLLPRQGGWSLETADGRVLVRGSGHAARRRCLEYARRAGVLSVLA